MPANVKGIIESLCIPVFVGLLIREALKVLFGVYKYKEEKNPLVRTYTKTSAASVKKRSGVAVKKKKRKK